MKDEISEELAVFLRGFHFIVPAEYFELFSVSELQTLIAGEPIIDVKEILKYASYPGYEKNPEGILWIQEIFNEFTQKELTAFVFFVTGYYTFL